jgi:hypothetical protein
MSSSPSILPTPRQLLTSILNQISRIPAPKAPPGRADRPAQKSSGTISGTDPFPERTGGRPHSNPLGLIEPRHRPLFTTLHVLFPSILLPALDLLDRGLVTRLAGPHGLATRTAPTEGVPLARQAERPDETHEEEGARGSQMMEDAVVAPSTPFLSVYTVHSAQKLTRRPHGGGDPPHTTYTAPTTMGTSSSQRAYIVHTAAWNCTCAAFAFSAFPPLPDHPLLAPKKSREEATMPTRTIVDDGDENVQDMEEEEGEGSRPWQFGSMSFGGCADAGGVPPCCKHLLACVLAEHWECGLGRYVNRWESGREEMAGVFADI